MLSPDGFGEKEYEKAILQVNAVLRERLPHEIEQLSEERVIAKYGIKRGFRRGWRIKVKFRDDVERKIDLLVGRWFPSAYPRTAIVDGPGNLIWPHVEYDGVLCLLPIMAEVDNEQPGEVSLHLLSRSVQLIEQLLEGSIIERDFRDEFLTYWAYGLNSKHKVTSLVDPQGPSREITIWRGDEEIIVAENKAYLERWLINRNGNLKGRKKHRFERAVFLRLTQPLLPDQYPDTGSQILEIAESCCEDGAINLLKGAAAKMPKGLTVIFKAEGRAGPGLIATTTNAHRHIKSELGKGEPDLTKGFQKRKVPAEVAVMRTFSALKVDRLSVERADAAWIHGRGQDLRTQSLLKKHVVVAGAGSIGSSVASRLAAAGVDLTIVDFDDLAWANLGRHELGADCIGENKASALAKKLQREYPHLAIDAREAQIQNLFYAPDNILTNCDLIVSAMGSWQAEGALNRWHISEGRRCSIVYGWTDHYALAGHAVVIAHTGGCLRCGIGRTGIPKFHAIELPVGHSLPEEPACGNHFSPYGPIELGYTIDTIASTALSTLLTGCDKSQETVWLANEQNLKEHGARWSEDLQSIAPAGFSGGQRLDRPWKKADCQTCRTSQKS